MTSRTRIDFDMLGTGALAAVLGNATDTLQGLPDEQPGLTAGQERVRLALRQDVSRLLNGVTRILFGRRSFRGRDRTVDTTNL